MKKFKTKWPSAEEIARMADRGNDVTPYIDDLNPSDSERQRKKNVRRINIDFGLDMLAQLDDIAQKLNISRQAMIQMALQEYLTRYHTAESVRLAMQGKSKRTQVEDP